MTVTAEQRRARDMAHAQADVAWAAMDRPARSRTGGLADAIRSAANPKPAKPRLSAFQPERRSRALTGERIALRIEFEIARNHKRDEGLSALGRNLAGHTAYLESLSRSRYSPNECDRLRDARCRALGKPPRSRLTGRDIALADFALRHKGAAS